MNEELIKNELQKYNMTDAAIAKLKTDYMVLTVKTPQDIAGYEIVRKARIDIKKRRVEVEKIRVQLKAESLEYGRRVDGEAKRITALLEPIEDHLIRQEKIVDDERARIKAEAEAKEAERFTARTDTLIQSFGATWNGHTYIAYGISIPAAIIKVCNDEQYEQLVAQLQEKKDAEDARIKAEEIARKAEIERLAKVAAEQEAERKRLAEEAQKQAEEAARMKAEQEAIEKAKQKLIDDEAARLAAIDREKKRVEDEKRRAEELEKAKKEAAEKALRDAEEKRKRDEEARIEKERLAKIAAEKKAARQPDKVKLLTYADCLAAVAPPSDLKTSEAKDILIETERALVDTIKALRAKADAL